VFGAAPSRKIFAYAKPTDMRKSFHGLLALVQKKFTKQDAYSGNLFVFVNRRGNYIKILAWDRTGFSLGCRRIAIAWIFVSFRRDRPSSHPPLGLSAADRPHLD
jgi:transposase